MYNLSEIKYSILFQEGKNRATVITHTRQNRTPTGETTFSKGLGLLSELSLGRILQLYLTGAGASDANHGSSISETGEVHHCIRALLRNSSSATHTEASAAPYDPSCLKTNFTWGTLSVTNSGFVQSCI